MNHRINYFNHSYTDIGNKIPPIPQNQIDKELIIMYAAEMHAFVSYFSLIVGDLVEGHDDEWLLYLNLYDIINLISKTASNEDELLYLDHLIREHHRLYMYLFNAALTPKFHFMLHYSRVIRNIGPLSKMSFP